MKLERRFLSQGELRVKKDDSGQKIAGYATKFTPAMSEDLGFFREQIDPHAFDACLAANPDVRGLWNHDANHVLGRTIAGTLRLSTDATGLFYEIDPPATNVAKDLMISMERGDVTQSSFGFICIEDTWREDADGNYIRTVLKAELFDVSPVTFPAYPDATSGVRALFPDEEQRNALQGKVAELRAAKEIRDAQKMKTVDGVALHAGSFAYAGDENDPESWKLPIKFPGDDAKTISHIKDALARFDQTEGIPDSEKAKVYDKIVAAAKEHGIHVEKETYNDYVAHQAEHRDAEQLAAQSAEVLAEVAVRTDGVDDDDDEDNECDCDCAACVLNDCANCLNGDCMDEECDSCPMQSQRSAADELETLQLRLEVAKRRKV